MKLKNKILLFLLLTGALFIMCSCYSFKTMATIANAKTRAAEYIQEKYGFTAEITDAIPEIPDEDWYPTEFVLVKMQYEGRDFSVGVYDENNCSDDYQAEEIKAAVGAEIEAVLPGLYEVRIESSEAHHVYESIEDDCDLMFHDFFDGTNALDKVLEGNRTKVIAYYVCTDLSPLEETHDFDRFLSPDNGTLIFLSCRSEEMTEFSPNLFNNEVEDDNAFFIDSSYVLSSDGRVLSRFQLADQLTDFENIFSYTVAGVNTDDDGEFNYSSYNASIGSTDDVHFKEIPADPEKLEMDQGNRGTFATPAFSVKADKKYKVTVFYPTDKIDDYSSSYSYAVVCDGGIGDKYRPVSTMEKYDSMGYDENHLYVYFELFLDPGEELYFAIANDEDRKIMSRK